jgi:hypothetical protein
MKSVCIHKLPFPAADTPPEKISAFLDTLGKEDVNVINWKEFSYRPEVRFSIAWDPQHIVYKFYVHESVIRARFTEDNAPVWQDSTVEFFVSPAEDGVYYNFEINCIGTCLAQKGRSRSPRENLQPDVIEKIRRFPSLGVAPFEEKTGDFSWDLMVMIPAEVFVDHKVEISKDKTFRANFYKCGDGLSRPHYLSWNPIDTENPDFHRPEFFGELKFC